MDLMRCRSSVARLAVFSERFAAAGLKLLLRPQMMACR